MNKPYTCHNCSTVFDAYPDSVKQGFEGPGTPPRGKPRKIKVRCPGCYEAGYRKVKHMVYVVDVSKEAKLVATIS